LLEGRGAFFHRSGSLAFQAQFQQLLGQDLTKFDDQVLQLAELSAPGRPGGAPDAIGEVFGDALNVGTDFFYLGTPFLRACHPGLPVEVAAKVWTNLANESTTPASCLPNQVPHPKVLYRSLQNFLN